jgi:hypothetical protein
MGGSKNLRTVAWCCQCGASVLCRTLSTTTEDGLQFLSVANTRSAPCELGAAHVISILGGEVMSIFTILFVVLLVAWLLGLSVFHVAGGLIHILLIFAVIALILHFVRGRRGVA